MRLFLSLQFRNLVRNRKLAKSIHDAGWGIFLQWVNYYGTVHEIPVIAVPPHYTSQKCSDCGTLVKKSLSVRTHMCPTYGLIMDRDQNVAKNILKKALSSHRGCTGGTRKQTDLLRETLLDRGPLLLDQQ